MFFVVVSSLCVYLSSHHCLYTYIITIDLLAFIHLSSLISIPYHHYSIQSIHLEISPDPLLRALSLSANLMLVPPPPGVGRAGVDNDGVAGLDNRSGRDCDVRSAHSPPGSFSTW